MSRYRGFTLVELIMTLVVISILAVVVGPRFFDRKVYDERLFFEETIVAVRYAQNFAIASGCAIQVSVRDDGYKLLKERNCDSLVDPPDFCSADESLAACEVKTSAGDIYEGMNTKEVSVRERGFPLYFDSLGIPKRAADLQCDQMAGLIPAACATIGAFTFSVTAETGLVQ
ncbi:MAG: prepilin-type N-terminal cleavage/methylation domain-containing protein [Pseudomonas balearica]|jgi:MSHA pilin protein MshC|nr:prepilin-type N-terminal cleavage/methylation domain-containing protein [Stutzerimonas balearica]